MNEFKLDDYSNLVPAFLKLRMAMTTRRPADGLYIDNGYETIHLEPCEAQEQKQKVKDFLSSYGDYVEKAITGDLTDEELNEEVLGRIKNLYNN